MIYDITRTSAQSKVVIKWMNQNQHWLHMLPTVKNLFLTKNFTILTKDKIWEEIRPKHVSYLWTFKTSDISLASTSYLTISVLPSTEWCALLSSPTQHCLVAYSYLCRVEDSYYLSCLLWYVYCCPCSAHVRTGMLVILYGCGFWHYWRHSLTAIPYPPALTVFQSLFHRQ